MRSYSCGKRQSLPRLRHARRSFCAIGSASAISIIVHAGIHSVAKAERFDVFVSAVVRTAADSIDAAVACGSATDAILRGTAADSIDAAVAYSPAADAVLCGPAADSVNWDTWLYCNCRNVQSPDCFDDTATTACATAAATTASGHAAACATTAATATAARTSG